MPPNGGPVNQERPTVAAVGSLGWPVRAWLGESSSSRTGAVQLPHLLTALQVLSGREEPLSCAPLGERYPTRATCHRASRPLPGWLPT